MNQEDLTIIVTRYFEPCGSLPDEWIRIWHFKKDYLIAFIKDGVAWSYQPSNFPVDSEQHFEDDVWVIHGDLLRRTCQRDSLWKNLENLINAVQMSGRGLNILIHPGGQTLGDVFRSLLPKLPRDLKDLFKDAGGYLHENPQVLGYIDTIIERRFNPHGQSENSQSINGTDYQKALKELQKFAIARTLLAKFFLLKHHLAHLFLPLDIDLQGICEVLSSESSPPSGKSKEEWAEECYRKAKAYYDEAFNDKSLQKIFEEKLEKAKEIVEREASDGMKTKILEKLEDNGVKKLKGQLGQLEPKAKLETFKNWAKENGNRFHSWFCGLMEYLNEIKVEFQQTVRAE